MGSDFIQMKNISKRFPGVLALSDVSFSLRSGEVHALVGENGAGKSTLMKILTGVYSKDSGSICVDGNEVEIGSIRDSQKLGIIMIHQELNLMNHLTCAQNIFIGREARKKNRLFLDENAMKKKTKEIFQRLNLDIDPSEVVGNLTVAKQQMVEIAKALSYNSKVLIMDEPTSSLTDSEIGDLFRVIDMLRSEGVGIIHISHRLEELKQISDRITVMRDGGYVGTLETREADLDKIISMMVGREVFITKQANHCEAGASTVLEAKGLCAGKLIQNVSFTLKKGEILGFAGLVGAGRTEVARLIFGADKKDAGELFIKGEKVNIRHPSDAVRHGIAYLSEDRKQFGVATGMNIAENISMANMKEFISPLTFLKYPKELKNAKEKQQTLNIKTPSVKQTVSSLSGGNQQKVVLGKWLTADCDILIFDEPTRGIDIGAKNEIYKLMNALIEQGKSIIMISSELPEILRTSHRVLVMCEGRITGELEGDAITQDAIMVYATQRIQ